MVRSVNGRSRFSTFGGKTTAGLGVGRPQIPPGGVGWGGVLMLWCEARATRRVGLGSSAAAAAPVSPVTVLDAARSSSSSLPLF